jgi:hypothetical protein
MNAVAGPAQAYFPCKLAEDVGYLVSVATDGFIDVLDLIVSVLTDTQ